MNENIEDLVKINNESSFESTNPFKSFRCKIHDDEISLFCLNEKETLCPSCVYHITEKHKKHRIIPLKCAYQIMSQENEKFRGVAKEKLQKIEDCIAFTMKNISILDRNLKNMTSGVEKEFLLLRNLIEKKEREIIGVINQLYLEKIQTYENKIKDLGFLHSCLNDYQFYEPNMKSEQKNNFVYVYNVNSILKKTLNNIDLNYKMLNISDLDKVSFPNKKKVFQEIENFVVIIQQNEAKNKSLMNISFKTNNSNSMKSKNNISYDGEKGNSFDFFGNQEILQQNNPNRSLNGFHKRSKTDLIHSHN